MHRQSPATRYCGRFAPSPTGQLHMGSLLTALASWLDARAHGGRWLLRIEDLDPPREEPGASAAIIDELRRHALHWDGELMYQSARADAYREALEQLRRRGLVYPCDCSRSRIRAMGEVYSGLCRTRADAPAPPFAWRVKVEDEEIGFEDAIQGHFAQHMDREVGDFVLLRKDGLFAYQLAVVVDDAAQGITHIVRGSDLLDSTPRQIHLQRLLGYPGIAYAHLPVLVNESGQKLSKQNLAPPLAGLEPRENLLGCLRLLQQAPPPTGERGSCEAILDWARRHWDIGAVPRQMALLPA